MQVHRAHQNIHCRCTCTMRSNWWFIIPWKLESWVINHEPLSLNRVSYISNFSSKLIPTPEFRAGILVSLAGVTIICWDLRPLTLPTNQALLPWGWHWVGGDPLDCFIKNKFFGDKHVLLWGSFWLKGTLMLQWKRGCGLNVLGAGFHRASKGSLARYKMGPPNYYKWIYP